MTGPNDDEPASSRKLADILREAGVSAAGAGGRRRRRDNAHTVHDDAGGSADSSTHDQPEESAEPAYNFENVHAADIFGTSQKPDFFDPAEAGGRAGQDSRTDFEALSSYLRGDTSARSTVPSTSDTGTADNRTADNRTADNRPAIVSPPRTDTGPVLTLGWATPGTGWPESSATPAGSSLGSPYRAGSPPAAVRSPIPSRSKPGGAESRPISAERASTATPTVSKPAATLGRLTAPVRTPTAAPGRTAAAVSKPAASRESVAGTSHTNRSASPIATTSPDDRDDTHGTHDTDEEDSAVRVRGGVASWAILAVELLAALGLGVVAWYAFSALWELLPYVAAFVCPLVVTGLVSVAGALRSRTGRNPLGLPTLCILVFAGTVMVVLPAATVIVP